MAELLGIDLASHQGPDFPFVRAYQEGYRFATPKVSGGKRYRNEHRVNQINGARGAGMLVAAYHYMWENTDLSGTPEEEFENFKGALGNLYTDETQIALDVEDDTATFNPQPNMTEWIVRYQDLCFAEYGRYPVLYLGSYFIAAHNLYDQRLTRSPLWLPSWQDAVPAPNYWLPWKELKIWQFASQATVAGRKPIDVDKFFGTAEEFKQLGRPAAPSPPASGPESIVASINADGNAVLTINFGGWVKDVKGYVVVDAGFSAIGNDGATYHRTVNPSGFQPWRKE